VPTRTTIRLAGLLRTLGEPNRLEIVRWLARRPGTISDVVREFALSQPLVSHHIRRLREEGLVERDEPVTRSRYRVRPDALEALSGELWIIGASAKGKERAALRQGRSHRSRGRS
jgi:ArsR family transcriptional regulator, arsenate/arsenite/antimonite-responsive transcriptional repressor